eukprot:TRINITY_DN50584_c0_g1_i1.p1 TRINITY_DN50584_c0_g1~~TRINITY_DN50584_c0_g1_i1.p1  ORF type:complete len:273 (-),score=68.70 TRINITY_DN50584_c0_g1_i1:119-937(-)
MASGDTCTQRIVEASVAEAAAIQRDRAGDVSGAIAKYEESEQLLGLAIRAALPAHAEDYPKLVQHQKEVRDRINHLKSPPPPDGPVIPVEQQIRAVQLAMQASSTATQATSAAGGAKQMAAAAAVGAVGGAMVLGSTLGGFVVVGAVAGGAAAGYSATRSDKLGEVARGVGAMAVSGIDKARAIDAEHNISGKVADAGSKAVSAASAVNEKYGITDKVAKGVKAGISKAQEIEEKHHVTSKVASGLAASIGKLATGMERLTQATSSSSSSAA